MSEARQRREKDSEPLRKISMTSEKAFLLKKLLYTGGSVKDRRRSSEKRRHTRAETSERENKEGWRLYRSYKLRYAWSWQEGSCG